MNLHELCLVVETSINQTISKRGARAVTALGASVMPGLVEIGLALHPGYRVAQLNAIVDDIGLAIGSNNVRLTQRGTTIYAQIPIHTKEKVSLAKLMNAQKVPSYTATLGIGEGGVPVHLRIASPDVAHVLIAGTTGSGKTVMSNTIAMSLASRHSPKELGIVYIDPKKRADNRFINSIQQHLLAPPIVDTNQAMQVLKRVVDVMEGVQVDATNRPRVLIIVDELADMLMGGGPMMEQYLTRIAQRGREPGFHLLLSTQKPSAKSIGPLLKANLPARLCGRVMSIEDSKVATGLPGLDAHRLAGHGQFLLVGAGKVLRIQGAVPDIRVRDWKALPHQETKELLFDIKRPSYLPTSEWRPASQLKYHPSKMPVQLEAPEEDEVGSANEAEVATTPIVDDLLMKAMEYLRLKPNATKGEICRDVMGKPPAGQHRLSKAELLLSRARTALLQQSTTTS